MLSEEDRQKAIQAFVQIQAQSEQATSTLESRLALLERQLADKLRLLDELRNEKAHLQRPVCRPPERTQSDQGSHASSWLSTGVIRTAPTSHPWPRGVIGGPPGGVGALRAPRRHKGLPRGDRRHGAVRGGVA